MYLFACKSGVNLHLRLTKHHFEINGNFNLMLAL